MNELLLKLIDMSITASILIAIILVIRIGFKKIPRKYICVLWALVAIRLVCPLNIESPFSAYNVVDKQIKQNSNTYINQFVKPDTVNKNKINDKAKKPKEKDKNNQKEKETKKVKEKEVDFWKGKRYF